MKDLLKRLLCVLMALTMVVALCACGDSSEDEEKEDKEKTSEEETKETEEETKETEEETTTEPEPTLVGEWEAKLDVGSVYSDMLGVDIDDLYMTWTIEFEEDGTYAAELGVEDFIEDYKAIYWDVLIQIVAEQAGCTESEAESAMEEQIEAEDMTKEEFVDAMMEEEGMTAESFGESSYTGDWELDGDELELDGNVVEIELEDDEFSIIEGEFPEEYAELFEAMLPIVFERV